MSASAPHQRLSTRLALALLFVGLAPVIGAGFLGVRAVKRDAIRNAEERLAQAAEMTLELVEDAIGRARDTLRNVGVLLGEELAESPANVTAAAVREQLVGSLASRVEPPDQFLELAYFNAKPFVGQRTLSIANVQQARIQEVQLLSPESLVKNSALASELLGSVLVNVAKSGNEDVREENLFLYEDLPTLRISTPVQESNGQLGALVGFIDFAAVEKRIERTFGDRFFVTVDDADGTPLFECGDGNQFGEGRPSRSAVRDGSWVVTVHEPHALAFDPADRAQDRVLDWALAAALLATCLALFLASRLTRPIAVLHEAAERMAAGDLSARARLQRGDEIGRLGESFDRMAESLERLDSAKESFVGNVSHELRSPLTALQASLANVTDGILGPLNEAQRVALDRAQGQTRRMGSIVETLLELVRLDAGSVKLQRTETDLAQLARGVAKDLSVEGESRIHVSGAGSVACDSGLARRALENLVENALKFGPADGNVQLIVDGPTCTVRDEGLGFEDETLFERFSQGQVRGVKSSGTGLGLAIVARIAALHGGTLQTVGGVDGGVTLNLGEQA